MQTTITLSYDAQNSIAQKTLEYILALGLFKKQEIEYSTEKMSNEKKKIDKIFDNYLIGLSNFKFNRDEANNYE